MVKVIIEIYVSDEPTLHQLHRAAEEAAGALSPFVDTKFIAAKSQSMQEVRPQ